MDKNFFDKWEFIQTTGFAKENPYEAEQKFVEYFKQYPKDYNGYPYYVYCLVTLGKFDEAEEKLNDLEKRYKSDPHFAKQDTKIKILQHDIVMNRLRLYSYQGRYEELYNYYLVNKKFVEKNEFSELIYYCRVKLNKLKVTRDGHNGYLIKQMSEYSKDDFLEHIKKHLAAYNMDLDVPNKNIFVPDFPIEQVLDEVKKYIPSNRRQCPGFWEDVYVFKYDECGRESNRLVDYFKVVCFHNTDQMITICPVEEGKLLDSIDLNYMVPKKEYKEIKKESKVEKFNKRYKR